MSKRSELAADASNRRYERLLNAPHQSAVLMDAPPEKGEDVRAFVHLSNWLLNAGLSAPEIIASNPAQGLLILEDFGDGLFARLCTQNSALELQLYEAAVDVLVHLAKLPAAAGIGNYDAKTYLRESRLLIDWYLPAITGQDVPKSHQKEFDRLIIEACAPCQPAVPVTVLRDYHSENLIWLGARSGVNRVGLLDYQDALAGHRAYDLVSLLEDARRDTSPVLRRAMFERYVAATGIATDTGFNGGLGEFQTACNILGAQRNIKIIGIFVRLCVRDKKPEYLQYLPRVWAHLQRDLQDPSLGALGDWIAEHVRAPSAEILEHLRGQLDAP